MSNPFAGLGLAAFGLWLALGQPQIKALLPGEAHAETATTEEAKPVTVNADEANVG